MRKLQQFEKPVKIIVIVLILLTLCFISFLTYLYIEENGKIESMSHFFTGDTESELTIEEEIPFDKKEVKDNSLNKGTSKIKQKGVTGKKVITFKVTKDRDGKEINRSVIKEQIVSEPINEIVAIGTKDIPKASSKNNNNSSSSNNSRQNYGSSSNTPNNNSNNNSNKGTSAHYCTNKSPGWDGRKFSRYYVKVSMPCTSIPGKWSPYVIEVSSSEFYSKPACSGKPGPDFIEEARCEVCGSDYYNGPDSSCKVYK